MKSSTSCVKRESSKSKWALVREIRRLHSRREPLNLWAVKHRHPDLVRQVFSVRPFWGWLQALRDAGIDYDEINIELDEVIDCQICGKSFRRLPKHLKIHGITAEDYRKEYNSETSSELERAKAQRNAGKKETRKIQERGPLPIWDAPWCKEIVLDRIAEYHRQGIPLNYEAIDCRERSLMNYALKYFGTWDQALKAIGMDPAQVRRVTIPGGLKYPTADSVLRAIRLRRKKRLPLNPKAILAPLGSPHQRDEPLYRRAIFHFGSLDNAVRQAGLPVQRLIAAARYTKPKAVLEEIQRRHREGLPLRAIALTAGVKKHRDKALYRHGARIFGSWNRAIALAGIPPQAMRFLGGRYPSPEAIIHELRRRAQAGLPLNRYQVQAGASRDVALVKCIDRHFATWSNALEAAKKVAGR